MKLELPFTLSHPIPEHYEEDMEPPPQPTDANADNINLELDETGVFLPDSFIKSLQNARWNLNI